MTGPAQGPRACQVDAERLAHLKRQMPLVLGANLAVSPFVAYTLRGSLGAAGATAWAAAVIALSLLRFLILHRQPAPGGVRALKRQEQIMLAGSLASGSLWGVLAAAGVTAQSGLDPLLALMFVSGMVAGAIGSLSTVPQVYAAFAIPAIGPVIAVYGSGPTLEENIYAFAALIFLSVNIGYSVNFSRSLRRTIELRFENAELIGSLEEARRRSEAESELKSRFLQSASHDLRQPLHAVNLLLADMADLVPGEGAEKMMRAQASVHSLAQLLDRLLEASLSGAGAMRAVLAPVDLQPVLRKLAFEFAPQAQANGIALHIRPSRQHILSDELMLTQILRNYIGNGLSHARSRVLVGVRLHRGMARLEVRDDGPGIDPAEHAAIFDAFYQVGNPERDPGHGHGLGLAIVRSMASLLGAPYGLHSCPGRGAVFYVTVPLSPPPPAPPAPGQEPARPAAGKAVLLVEDNADLRRITADLLIRWGYAVSAVEDGAAALAAVEAGLRPAAVITDLLLPGERDGLATLREIEAKLGARLPAVVVTGNAVAPEALGGAILLRKPLVPGRLRAWLSATLG